MRDPDHTAIAPAGWWEQETAFHSVSSRVRFHALRDVKPKRLNWGPRWCPQGSGWTEAAASPVQPARLPPTRDGSRHSQASAAASWPQTWAVAWAEPPLSPPLLSPGDPSLVGRGHEGNAGLLIRGGGGFRLDLWAAFCNLSLMPAHPRVGGQCRSRGGGSAARGGVRLPLGLVQLQARQPQP